MGLYLNTGNDLFMRAVQSQIYVDKSMMIAHTNRVIQTEQQFICVSRPRRFGKSMGANMLNAYYSIGSSSDELFDGLKIQTVDSYGKHLNKYNVFQLNMQDFLTASKRDMDRMIDIIVEDLCEDIGRVYPDIQMPRRMDLGNYMATVYAETKIPFIVIIDEWDCIFRVHQEDKEAQTKYLDFLRNFLKDKAYIALAYMTGILPIKKYGQHSALNMFTEISVLNPREYAAETGFTEEEVKELCGQFGMPYEEVKSWYNGYYLRGISVYNPRSVVMSMTGHDFDNYWTQTETYEALKKYIVLNIDGLKDKVKRLVAGERIPVRTETFQNDMTSVTKADDVFTLLIHLGYLTYDFDNKVCWIPNREVEQEFVNSIGDGGWEDVVAAIDDSEELMRLTWKKDEDAVARRIKAVHDANTSILQYNDENSLACVLSLAYYSAKRSYTVYRELATGEGFADFVFLPKHGNANPPMVVELKCGDTAESAVAQIRKRDYLQKPREAMSGCQGKMLLVGIAYDKGSKTHICRIEEA